MLPILKKQTYEKIQRALRKFYLGEIDLEVLGDVYQPMGLLSAATSCYSKRSEEVTDPKVICSSLTKLALCYLQQGEGYIYDSFCYNMCQYALDKYDGLYLTYSALADRHSQKGLKFEELMTWKRCYKCVEEFDGPRSEGYMFLRILELSEQLFRVETDDFYTKAKEWFENHHKELSKPQQESYINCMDNQAHITFSQSIMDEVKNLPDGEKSNVLDDIRVADENIPYTVAQVRGNIIPTEFNTLLENLPASCPRTFIQFTDDPWDNTGMLLDKEGFKGYTVTYVGKDRFNEYLRFRSDTARIVNGIDYIVSPRDFTYNGREDDGHGALLVTFREHTRLMEHLKVIPFGEIPFKAVVVRCFSEPYEERWLEMMRFMKLKGYTLRGQPIKIDGRNVGCILTRRS